MAWTVCRFNSGLAKKGVGVFEGDRYPNAGYGKLNHRLTDFFFRSKIVEGSHDMQKFYGR